MIDSEGPPPGFLKALAARFWGRKAAQGIQTLSPKDVTAARQLVDDPKTQADFIEGAAQVHWSNPNGPTGGMPPGEPLEPETPPQPPPPKPKP